MSENDFMEGYIDGGDLDAPEPSANRSHAYRHSFAVRRAEVLKRPIPAEISRKAAVAALMKDMGA